MSDSWKRLQRWTAFSAFVLAAVAAGTVLAAPGDNNLCDEAGEGPDVIVGALPNVQYFGTVGGISAYSVATESCNIGNCWLEWTSNTNKHPVIGQNMFRLLDGRFEQIGQSWLKHGFFALSDNLCFSDCQSTSGGHLGVHCSDLYSSGLNGDQDRLGPRFEVNATTGVYPYPATDLGLTGNAIYKRLQVSNDDLRPADNPGARYFLEGLYITYDDALAGNSRNNASFREFQLNDNGNDVYTFSPLATTERELPAIQAWVNNVSGVKRVNVNIPNDGLVIVGYSATNNGDGTWHYEYAIQNLTSHRGIGSFEVPFPSGAPISKVEFHDVDYHSGEPVVGTDWAGTVFAGPDGKVMWQTEAWSGLTDDTANAIRWGTMYNFRFDTPAPPVTGTLTLGIFRPGGAGDPDTMQITGRVPDPNASVPISGDVEDTLFVNTDGSDLTLDWGVSCIGVDTDYAIYEGVIGNFADYSPLQCSTGGDITSTFPLPLDDTFYLVVPRNADTEGSYGRDSDDFERPTGIGACQTQSIAPCQ